MAVGIENNCSTSPLGIARCAENCSRIIAQRGDRIIYRWNSETNARADRRVALDNGVKFKHATARELCRNMLRS
jgi:hypothetical protein